MWFICMRRYGSMAVCLKTNNVSPFARNGIRFVTNRCGASVEEDATWMLVCAGTALQVQIICPRSKRKEFPWILLYLPPCCSHFIIISRSYGLLFLLVHTGRT